MPPTSARKRTIVYVWDADYPWDVRTEKTCLALTQAGHDVHIVARNRKWSPEIERLHEGTVHRMRPLPWAGKRLDNLLGFPAFFNPRWKVLLARTVLESRADLIIARDLPLCPTAIHVGRKARIPVILDMAENYPAMLRDIRTSSRRHLLDVIVRNPKAGEAVERYCVAHVDHVITVVEESAERVRQMGLSPNRVSVVSNTPSKRRVRDPGVRAVRLDSTVDIVYLGLMEVSRGIGDAIEAIAQLRNAGHHVRLRLIGGGRDEALFRQQAHQLKLSEDIVTFFGYVPYTEALGIVEQADIGLIPHYTSESWNTTIPNKLFDYMAAGLPVLGSNAIPCARILAETGAGTVFKSKDPLDLAAAVVKMLDPDVRARAGEAGRQAIVGRYNWEYDTNTLIKLVESI